jgi:SIR2-like domain
VETAETSPEQAVETSAGPAEELPAGLADHCRRVSKAFRDGDVVPFLGAGANLCGRAVPPGKWTKPSDCLPSGRELSEYLAREFDYPFEDKHNLLRVAQYQDTMEGAGPLKKHLREVFVRDYPPTRLHSFLASLPQRLDQGFGRPRYQLVVTTNYDDALERAYVAAKQPFDLFSYIAEGDLRGRFHHVPAEGPATIIKRPKTFDEPILAERPVVLKIHGAIDRSPKPQDSFVITEDHYIDFLQRTDLEDLLPKSLLLALQETHFLFLGYALTDWNLRVLLEQIWRQQNQGWGSWAVQHETSPFDQKAWTKRSVDIHVVDLLVYVGALEHALETLAAENAAQDEQ